MAELPRHRPSSPCRLWSTSRLCFLQRAGQNAVALVQNLHRTWEDLVRQGSSRSSVPGPTPSSGTGQLRAQPSPGAGAINSRASCGCEAVEAAASAASHPLPRPPGSMGITSRRKYAGQP